LNGEFGRAQLAPLYPALPATSIFPLPGISANKPVNGMLFNQLIHNPDLKPAQNMEYQLCKARMAFGVMGGRFSRPSAEWAKIMQEKGRTPSRCLFPTA
jgi:hypothetical protein